MYKYVAIFIFGLFSLVSSAEELGYSGYKKEGKSVEDTLNDLKNDESFEVYVQGGWTIASSKVGVMYSFTPSDHPAHPSYVERRVIERDGSIYINMSARCGASKDVCDDLVRSFQELNKKIIESMGR